MSLMHSATHPTLYRIHPVSFRDGNGDGVGDVEGLLSTLPYFDALSVDGLVVPQVWLADASGAAAARGLTLWHGDDTGHLYQDDQPYASSPLAQQVVPFSAEKLVGVLNARRHRLADSVWSTGDANQPRVVSHWGQGDLRSADAFLTLLALLPAPICLYQGEELGLPHAADLHDPLGAQTPMPWHEAPEQVTAGEIHWYQQVAIEHRALAISRQQHDGQSTLQYCRSLLALRRLPVIQHGELQAVSQQNGLVRLLITHQDQCLEALINLQPYTQAAAPSEATMPWAWQTAQGQEGHQWVLAGFASAIFTRNVNCESRGVTHG
ncbi:TPA: hypothetical protein ACKQPR_002901 [Serratia odorifera]|nr:hypothetical protein [Serratia odorifera]